MSEPDIAKRIHKAITQNGGYEKISEATGISVSTLVRASKGKTDPKLKDVITICKVTGAKLLEIAYGENYTSPQEKCMNNIAESLSMMNEMLVSDKISELEHQIGQLKKAQS